MSHLSAIEEAAQFVAAGKGEAVIAKARHALADMRYAVEIIIGKTPSVMKRASKSTGTERLSFIIGDFNVAPNTVLHAGEAAHNAKLTGKAQEVFEYLTSRGVDAERVNLGSSQPGFVRHAVDVTLNDKVLQFVPGQKTAATLERHGIGKTF